MATVTTDDKHYKAIAAAIRNNSGGTENIKPEEMANCVNEIASNSYYRGETDGAELGRRDERERFWSVFQNHGEAMSYQHAFSNGKFTDANYNPQYPIRCSTSTVAAQSIFYNAPITDTKVDIIVGLNRPTSGMFDGCSELRTIRKLVLSGTNTFSSTFTKCAALESITFEGVISNDISFADSPKLTKASITNIINCLSATASGKTLTLSIIAVAEAFATDETDGIGSAEWDVLGGDNRERQNWTISLV